MAKDFNVDELPDLTQEAPAAKPFNVDDLPDLKKKEPAVSKLESGLQNSTSVNGQSKSISPSLKDNPTTFNAVMNIGKDIGVPLQKNFEKRIQNPVLRIKNQDGSASTHEMMSWEQDGRYFAAPTIVEKEKGKLIELSEEDAVKYALQTGEFKEFKTDQEAKDYANNGYKKGTPLEEKTNPLGVGTTIKEPRQTKYVEGIYDVSKGMTQKPDNTATPIDEQAQIKSDIDTGTLDERNPTTYIGASKEYSTKAKDVTGKDDAQALIDYGKVIGVDEDLLSRLPEMDKNLYQNNQQLDELLKQRDILSKTTSDNQEQHLKDVDKSIAEIEKSNAKLFATRNSQMDADILSMQKQLDSGIKQIPHDQYNAQGVWVGKTYTQEPLNDEDKATLKTQITDLVRKKGDFLEGAHTPEQTYKEFHPQIKMYEDKNIIPKDASAIDKLKIYYGISLKQLQALKDRKQIEDDQFSVENTIGNLISDNTPIPDGVVESLKQRLPFADDKTEKSIKELESRLSAIAPVIAINRTSKANSLGKTFVNKFVDGLTQKTQHNTSQESAIHLQEALNKSGIELSDDKKELLEKQVKGKLQGQFGENNMAQVGEMAEFMMELTATSAAIPFAGIEKGVVSGLEKISPKGRALLGMVANGMKETKLGKLIYDATEEGLKMEAVGTVNKRLEEGATFSQGVAFNLGGKLGGVMSAKLAGLFGAELPKVIQLASTITGRTITESVKMGTADLVATFEQTGGGKQFMDAVKEKWGDLDHNLSFAIQMVALATVFSGTEIGNTLGHFIKKVKSEFSPVEVEKFDAITHGLNAEVNDVSKSIATESETLISKNEEKIEIAPENVDSIDIPKEKQELITKRDDLQRSLDDEKHPFHGIVDKRVIQKQIDEINSKLDEKSNENPVTEPILDNSERIQSEEKDSGIVQPGIEQGNEVTGKDEKKVEQTKRLADIKSKFSKHLEEENNAELPENNRGDKTEEALVQLKSRGEQIQSLMDAERRWSNGERLFASHELDEQPFEITNFSDLKKYAPDQLMSLPKEKPTTEVDKIIDEVKAEEKDSDAYQALRKNFEKSQNNTKLQDDGKQDSTGQGNDTAIKGQDEGLQNDLRKDKIVVKRKGTPLARRKIKSPTILKALALEVTDAHDLAQKWLAGGGKLTTDAILSIYGKANLSREENLKRTKAERKARQFSISDKDGFSIGKAAERIAESQENVLGLESDVIESALIDVINTHTSREKMAQDLLDRHGLSQEDTYEESQYQKEYEEHLLAEQIKEDFDAHIHEATMQVLESMSPEELAKFEEGKDKAFEENFIDELDADKPATTETDGVAKAESLVKEKQRSVDKFQSEYDKLSKKLSENLNEDQIDMFGQNKPQGLFNDKADQQKLVTDKKTELESAKKELSKANEDLVRAKDAVGQEKMVFKDETKEGFTEGVELNRIFKQSKEKYGEKDGSKYNEVVDRLVNPNTNTIIEVRSNGVVVKEGDKYNFKPFTNTDAHYKKWELGKPIDVTEQFKTPSSKSQLTKDIEQKKSDIKNKWNDQKKLRVFSDPKREAQAQYDFHKDLVDLAKLYLEYGYESAKEFARELKLPEKLLKNAWDEATGKKEMKLADFDNTGNHVNKGLVSKAIIEAPEVKPKETEPTEKPQLIGGRTVKKTLVTKRVYEGEFREEVKKELEQYGLTRTTIPYEEAEQIAKDIIEKHGLDTALESVRAGDVTGGAASEIIAAKIEDLDTKISKSKDDAEILDLISQQARLLNETGSTQTDYGQFNAQWAHIYKKSDLGYKLEIQKEEYRKNNNGDLPPEIEKKFEELSTAVTESKKRIEELEAQQQEIEDKYADSVSKEVFKEAVKEAYKKGRLEAGVAPNKSFAQRTKAVADEFRKLKTKPLVLKDADGNVINITQNAIISWNDIIELGAKAIEKTGEIADGIKAVIDHLSTQDWYTKLSNRDRDAVNKQIEDNLKIQEPKDDGKLKISKGEIRKLVEEHGFDNIEDLAAEVQKSFPESTHREVRDAITDYGKVKKVNNDPVDRAIRKMARMGRMISALEDIENDIRPSRTGAQRDKPEPDERAKIKELKDALKKMKPTDADLSQKLKTIQDAIETRLRNRIADIDHEIKTGQKPIRPTKVEDTPAITELREQKAQKEEELREFRSKNKVQNTLDEIADEAEKSKASTITKKMVVDGLIHDLISAHIENGTPLENIEAEVFAKLQEVLPDVTEKQMRDAFTKHGEFKSEPKEIQALQKQLAELKKQANLKSRIEELQQGIVRETKARGEQSEEVKALQKQLAEAKKEALNKYAHLSAKELQKSIERTIKSTEEYKRRVRENDLIKQKNVKQKFHKDPQWRKIYKELEAEKLKKAKAKNEFDYEQAKVLAKNRGNLEKLIHKLTKYQRFMIFLNPWGMGRLAIAAMYRPVMRIPTEAAKLALSHIPIAKDIMLKSPGMYRKNPMQSYRAIKEYYATLFSKKTFKDALSEYNRRSNYDLLHDGKGEDRYTTKVERVLAAPEQTHGFMKAFPKISADASTYKAALENLSNMIDPQTGEFYDITDPATQQLAIGEAQREGYAEVFMDSAELSQATNQFLTTMAKSENLMAQATGLYAKQLLPVVKVPINFYHEVLQMLPFVGMLDAAQIVARSGKRDFTNTAGHRGIKNLDNDQAFRAARAMVNQTMGLMGLAIGIALYRNDDKIKEKIEKYHYWLHNTALPIVMMGIKAAEDLDHGKNADAAKEPLNTVKEETMHLPQVRAMRDILYASDKKVKTMIANIMIPSVANDLAKRMDHERKRDPKTFQQIVEMRIPGFEIGGKQYGRPSVPLKAAKGDGGNLKSNLKDGLKMDKKDFLK